MFGRAVFLIRANQRDFLADVFVQEFGGFEEIVFVILLDHAQFVRLGQGAEMYRGGIHGSRDVHEFEAESASWQGQLSNVANQRDIGVVDRDGEVGLVVQIRSLVGGRRTSFLALRAGVVAARGGI